MYLQHRKYYTYSSTAILCVMDYLMEMGRRRASSFHKDVFGRRGPSRSFWLAAWNKEEKHNNEQHFHLAIALLFTYIHTYSYIPILAATPSSFYQILPDTLFPDL